MQHEILLALQGHCGDIVLDKRDCYVLNPDLKFVADGDRELLNQLIELGSNFQKLNGFQSTVLSMQSNYLFGISAGIQEVLDKYQLTLVSIENEMVSSRQVVPFTRFLSDFHEFRQVFPILTKIIQSIQRESLKGVDILELVFRHSQTGFSRVKFWMQRLLFHCNKVVWNQIYQWIVHGKLMDSQDEFFIKSLDHQTWEHFQLDFKAVPLVYFSASVAQKIFSIGKAVVVLKKCNRFDRSDTFTRTLMELKAQPVFQPLIVERAIEKMRKIVAQLLWTVIVTENHLITHLFKLKDFFLLGKGEFYQTFIESSATMMNSPVTSRSQIDINQGPFQMSLRSHALDQIPVSLTIPIDTFKYDTFNDDLFGSDLTRTTSVSISPDRKLHLNGGQITCPKVQNVSHGQMDIHFQSNASLLCYLNDQVFLKLNSKTGIVQFMKQGKDQPIESVQTALSTSPTHLRLICQSPKLTCWVDGTLVFETEEMESMSRVGLTSSSFGTTIVSSWSFETLQTPDWKKLGLSYDLPWPIPLVVSRNALHMYNRLFQFLFPLKKTAWMLQNCWNTSSNTKSTKFWLLRSRMNFLLDNLLFYFQVTIIDGAFVELQTKIESSKDIETVKMAHENYLASITKQCYLESKTLRQALDRVLTCCQGLAGGTIRTIRLDEAKVTEMDIEFTKASSYLFTVLHKTNARDLILHLDYNEYFSTIAYQLVGL